uniref:Uncharacterized protein n=1 Tax=Rhizophora mucronata TaxID=61149 RepID=A0A2P2PMS4_RHIMU
MHSESLRATVIKSFRFLYHLIAVSENLEPEAEGSLALYLLLTSGIIDSLLKTKSGNASFPKFSVNENHLEQPMMK